MDFNQEILELLSASLQRQDRLVEEFSAFRSEFSEFRKETNDRLGRLEHQQVTTNMHIIELKHSVQRLNEQMENFAQHEERIRKLESFMRKAS